MRTFHPDVEAQIIRETQNFSQLGLLSLSCIQGGFQTSYQSRRRKGKYDAMWTLEILIKHAPKMNFHFPTWICSLIQLLGMLCFHSWMASAAIIRSERHPRMQPRQPFELPWVTFIILSCASISKMPELHIKGP